MIARLIREMGSLSTNDLFPFANATIFFVTDMHATVHIRVNGEAVSMFAQRITITLDATTAKLDLEVETERFHGFAKLRQQFNRDVFVERAITAASQVLSEHLKRPFVVLFIE